MVFIYLRLQDEMETVKFAGNQGRGKDILTIEKAEREEREAAMKAKLQQQQEQQQQKDGEEEAPPPILPQEFDAKGYSDDDAIFNRKRIFGRKKHRKLNSLEYDSEDDAYSDEDFKGTRYETKKSIPFIAFLSQ